MTRDELERILEEQGQKGGGLKCSVRREKICLALNIIFMILGVVGVILYFYNDTKTGLLVVGTSLIIKVMEFLVRYLL